MTPTWKRTMTIAVAALLALGPAHTALAGSSTDYDVNDAAGDANALSVQNAKLSTAPASVAAYDILGVWFGGGGSVNVRLATTPGPVGLYVVAFDAPGCTLPPSAPLPVSTSAAVDDHPGSGVGLALDLKSSVGNAYYVCNVSGNTWGVTYVSYHLSGNTITFNIPAGGHLQVGATISHPYAMSAIATEALVDITPVGRNAVL
jgi:hypothetical protein